MQQGLTATCKDCGSEPMAEKSREYRIKHMTPIVAKEGPGNSGLSRGNTATPRGNTLRVQKGLSDMTDRIRCRPRRTRCRVSWE